MEYFVEFHRLGVVIIVTVFLTSFGYAKTELTEDICSQPPEVGSCRAKFLQWFHNASSGKCEEFIYGGCPGSENRFPTREECIQTCSPDICELPAVQGPCRANIRLWYFEPITRHCNQFTYGGCEGNENKFHSEHTCLVACGKSSLQCPLGDTFRTIGHKAIHEEYRTKEWFVRKCESKCNDLCLDSHPWGHCMAFSVRKRWYGCNCYLFSRSVSTSEFDPDTDGITKNRNCASEDK